MSRGHLREGSRVIGQTVHDLWRLSNSPNPLFAEAALLGAVPAETVAAVLEKRLADPVAVGWVRAFPWWGGRRDTASLRTAEWRADSLARTHASSDPVGRRRWSYVRASAAAYLTLARGDSAGALEQFLALPADFCPACYLDRFTLAHLLVERRRDQEAWRMLAGPYPPFHWSGPFPSEILWVLMRGRLAERIGEHERAARSYAWVAGMWRNADPELQPYVAEARAALARLGRAEPRL